MEYKAPFDRCTQGNGPCCDEACEDAMQGPLAELIEFMYGVQKYPKRFRYLQDDEHLAISIGIFLCHLVWRIIDERNSQAYDMLLHVYQSNSPC